MPATLWAPRGEVRFEDVSFAYPASGAPVLSDVSFKAQPGSCIALVGHTGAGKSTAMTLLQRLWDPTSGRITIDGQDLRDITLDSLRSNIGVVFQESLLFNRSIRDNLMVGRPDATEEEMEQACRMADAHEFIIRQAERLRHDDRRARHDPVRRSAPASGDRSGAAEEPADPDPGRGDQRAGRGDRGAGQQGAEDTDGRAHDLYHRPPAFDRS